MSSLMENSSSGSQNLEEDYGNENEESKTSPVLAGIVFTNDFTSDDEFPPNMKVSNNCFRWLWILGIYICFKTL